MKALKVFLSGKIGPTYHWRESLLTMPIQAMPITDNEWPIIPGVVLGGNDYVGPFYRRSEHVGEDHSNTGIYDHCRTDYEITAALCIEAIKKADLVFAWLGELDCYGTLVEVGIARGLGKDVWVAGLPGLEIDLWFAAEMGGTGLNTGKTLIQDHFNKALETYRSKHGITLCESPMEEAFYEACKRINLEIKPQQPIGRYRADFVLADNIVIEIDGHESHKSKEQRTHDAARDRYLTSQGYQVVRFTGSEVFKDADNCAQQLFGILKSKGLPTRRIFSIPPIPPVPPMRVNPHA